MKPAPTTFGGSMAAALLEAKRNVEAERRTDGVMLELPAGAILDVFKDEDGRVHCRVLPRDPQ